MAGVLRGSREQAAHSSAALLRRKRFGDGSSVGLGARCGGKHTGSSAERHQLAPIGCTERVAGAKAWRRKARAIRGELAAPAGRHRERPASSGKMPHD